MLMLLSSWSIHSISSAWNSLNLVARTWSASDEPAVVR
jgi:hypothetical protein